MSSWIERYRSGDCAQVWTEMSSLGAQIREDDSWADALEVGRETMLRVRANVERLIELLPERGYVFRADPELPVFTPPPPNVGAELDQLEERSGRLPLALRLWFEEVGQVNLIGEHPDWDYDYTDPLVVWGQPEHFLAEYEDWRDDPEAWGPTFVVTLAPDFLHKANVSGGPPYGMALPNDAIDGLLLWEPHQTTFVNYLRICFRWGGFPGWDSVRQDWAAPPMSPPGLLPELAQSLLPI